MSEQEEGLQGRLVGPKFHVTRQNEKGFEFFITVHEMTSRPVTQRAVTGIFRFQPGSPE